MSAYGIRPMAVVTTDGSCITGHKGGKGPGGWAAIIEDGHEGRVLRGQAMETTSTKMELAGVIEGLSSLPDGKLARLDFDCTAILHVHDRWMRHALPVKGKWWPNDAKLWLELMAQFDRLHVELNLLVRGQRNLVHRRAHMIAQAQARAMAQGVAPEQVPLMPKLQLGTTKRRHLIHLPGCTPLGCVDLCPFQVREMRRLRRMGSSSERASARLR